MLTQIKIDQNTGVIEKTQKLNDLFLRGSSIFLIDKGIDIGLTPIIKKQIMEMQNFTGKDINPKLSNMSDYKYIFEDFKINLQKTADVFNRKQLMRFSMYYDKYKNLVDQNPKVLNRLKYKVIDDAIKEINDLSFERLKPENIKETDNISNIFKQTNQMRYKIFNNLNNLQKQLELFKKDLKDPYDNILPKTIMETENNNQNKNIYLFLKIIGGIALFVLLTYIIKAVLKTKPKNFDKKTFIKVKNLITEKGIEEIKKYLALLLGAYIGSIIGSLLFYKNISLQEIIILTAPVLTVVIFVTTISIIIAASIKNKPLGSREINNLFTTVNVLVCLVSLYFIERNY